LTPEELDNSDVLHSDDMHEWSDSMLHLVDNHGFVFLGGCCGTNPEHIDLLTTKIDFISPIKEE
jgi:methionine synthase I (cobalamin-dependent)